MIDIKSFLFKGPKPQIKHDSWFCTAMEESVDGLWDWDLSQGTLYISLKLQDLLGFSSQEILSQLTDLVLNRVHPDDKRQVLRIIEDVKTSKTESIFLDAFRIKCRNGEYIWLENHASVLRDANGAPIRIAGMAMNITPQKYILNQLYSIINEQEKENKNKIRFLSALSHEFRSPLSGIIGMQTLLKETNMNSEQHHFVDNISNSTEMLLNLVNDILDFTKLNSGKFDIEIIRFSPGDLIEKSIDLIRPNITKKGLSFNTLISSEMPKYLKGDPTRVQQILVNLLSNAVKFTSKGGISLLVKSTATHPSEGLSPQHKLYFEIADTGIGIAPEVQEQLFEDFTQGDKSISRLYGGTGLGLAICKELVQLMGGEIGVKSEPERGSTFWFTIPFGAEEPESANILTASTGTPKKHSMKKLKILVVEDNEVNQEILVGLLNLFGDEVISVNNGQEAVDQCKDQRFDIILMDLNLPVMDGLKATQAIRKLPHGNIPIIAITANTFSGEEQNCHTYGINQVLHKPIDKITLEMALLPHRGLIQPENKVPETISQKTLQTLVQDLGKEKVKSLFEMYRKDAFSLVSQIKTSSPQERNSQAHTLAGMSENLGIMLVGKTARKIMDSSQTEADNLPHLIQDLEAQFQSAVVEFQELLEGDKSDRA